MASRAAVALTAVSFDEAIASAEVALVDFWAPWCQPCRVMAPDLEQVAREADDGTLVAKVNIDEQPELAERFSIQSVPTVMTFAGGEFRDRYSGAVPAAGLRVALAEAAKPKRRGLFRRR